MTQGMMPTQRVRRQVDSLIQTWQLPIPILEPIYDFLKILSNRLSAVEKQEPNLSAERVSDIVYEVINTALPGHSLGNRMECKHSENWRRLRAFLPLLRRRLPEIMDKIFVDSPQFARAVNTHLRIRLEF